MSGKKEKNLNAEQEHLLDEMRRAFADVPYPGHDGITKAHFTTFGDECDECAGVRAAFRDKNWRLFLEEPYELLGYFAPRKPTSTIGRDFLPLLQVGALHYFLPLFLAAMIVDREEADVMLESIPRCFDPGPKKDGSAKDAELWAHGYERCRQLLALMSEEQRHAAAAALNHIFKDDPDAGVRPTPYDAILNLENGAVVAWDIVQE